MSVAFLVVALIALRAARNTITSVVVLLGLGFLGVALADSNAMLVVGGILVGNAGARADQLRIEARQRRTA